MEFQWFESGGIAPSYICYYKSKIVAAVNRGDGLWEWESFYPPAQGAVVANVYASLSNAQRYAIESMLDKQFCV